MAGFIGNKPTNVPLSSADLPDNVVTSAKIIDDAVTLDKMAGLVRGKIIVGDASGNPSALTVGSNGQALVSDGTDISWGSAGASAINALSDATTGGGTGNVGLGSGTLDALTSGSYNIGIGYNAGTTMTDGAQNVLIGGNAGHYITSGGGNICIGMSSGDAIT